MDELDVNIKKYLEWQKKLPKTPELWVTRAKSLMSAQKSDLKCPHCGKGITPFKSPVSKQVLMGWLWLGLSAAGFMASFVFKLYFLQCLALCLIFGFKFIVDRKQTKTQIVIYKAMENDKDFQRQHNLPNPSSERNLF